MRRRHDPAKEERIDRSTAASQQAQDTATAARTGQLPPFSRSSAQGRLDPLHATELQALQRAYGNRAVRRLIHTGSPRRDIGTADATTAPVSLAMQQREDQNTQALPQRHIVQRLTTEEQAENLTSPTLAGNERLERAFDNKPPLKAGETGKPVRLLQHALVDDGHPMPKSTRPDGELDGVFAEETKATVQKFQQEQGLGPDGVVGRQVLRALDRRSGGGGLSGCVCPPGAEPEEIATGQPTAPPFVGTGGQTRAKTCPLCKPKITPPPPVVTQPQIVRGSMNFRLEIEPMRWTGQTSAVMMDHNFAGRIKPTVTCTVLLPANWMGKIGLVQNTEGLSFGAQYRDRLWAWAMQPRAVDFEPTRESGPFMKESAANGALVSNPFPKTREYPLTFTFSDIPADPVSRFAPCKKANGKTGRGPQVETMTAIDRFRLGEPALQLATSGMYMMMSSYTFSGGMPQPLVEERGAEPTLTEGANPPLALTGTPAVITANQLHAAEEQRLTALPCP